MQIIKVSPTKRCPIQSRRVRVYVDGSSDNRLTKTGGWAAVIIVPCCEMQIVSGAIEPPTNNQKAELTAASKGLEFGWNAAFDNLDWGLFAQGKMQVEIISDSLYVVKGITEYIVNWSRLTNWHTTEGKKVKHRALWERIQQMDNEDTVWTHIRGHQGNIFNEMADQAASAARHLWLQKNPLYT